MAHLSAASAPQLSSSHALNGDIKLEKKAQLGVHSNDLDSLNVCASPGSGSIPARRSRKGKEESLLSSLRSWIVQHQIGLSVNLLLLHALIHICFPRARRRTSPFFELSYFDQKSGKYTRGPEDVYFVAYWIVIFTGLRAFFLSYVLLPFAEACGIFKGKTKTRFAEQAWMFLYYTVSWLLGMYIMYGSNYWLNFPELWSEFPLRTMTGLFKWYYLVQFAFWVQQIVVVNIEEPRKDHWQMFTHHIVTCLLMVTSYGYYETKVGNVILCLMDFVDIALPTAKMLKYAGCQTACDVAFGIFIVSWFLTRHVCYLLVCWSIYADVPDKMVYGCYSSVTGTMIPQKHSPASDTSETPGGNEILTNIFQPYLDPGGPICYNERIRVAFVALLFVLQGITIMWFGMIIRVAWRVLNGQGAGDSRSDDEGDGDPGEEEEGTLSKNVETSTIVPLVETNVGVEGLNLKRKGSPRYRTRKTPGATSGISLAGDKKELLGRIGCDKPS